MYKSLSEHQISIFDFNQCELPEKLTLDGSLSYS